jgi:hypothetical protein
MTNAFVGVHGRNSVHWGEIDHEVLKRSKVQCVKMMSHTAPSVFERIAQMSPKVWLTTRLYDPGFGVGHIVAPGDFVAKMVPTMEAIRPWCTDFEIHNEPNHPGRFEGWGSEAAYATSFNAWFLDTQARLRSAAPWATFGFPGLAVPHNDLQWLDICKASIDRADWLGCHCYWQNPTQSIQNHLSSFWGLRCELYHAHIPYKLVKVTEAGNSNHQTRGLPHDENAIAGEIVENAEAIRRLDYTGHVAYFILSSPDPTWGEFAWRTENGNIKPLVSRMGSYIETLE